MVRPLRVVAWALACAVAGGACSGAPSNDGVQGHPGGAPPAAIHVVDDLRQTVTLAAPAQRIISLIPSATETVIALGGADRIVGRTRYDVAAEVAGVPSVGGSVDASVERIVSLRPDLVIAWESDKRQTTRARLAQLGIPTFAVRTQDTSDVFRTIANIGRLLGRDSSARALSDSLRRQLDAVRRSIEGRPRPRVMYVVFNDPPMTAGPGTFITQLIAVAGGESIFDDAAQLWPNVSMEEIVRRNPDLVILPVGEFRENSVEALRRRPGWRDVEAVRRSQVVTVPADLLSRPGAHIAEAARVLRDVIHPEWRGYTRSGGAAGR